MFTLMLPAVDDLDAVEVHLEHSLVSLSKWESFYEKVFFSKDAKTQEETLKYIEQMIINGEVPPKFQERLAPEHVNAVNEYINSKQTATWFQEQPKGSSSEVVTNELIYFWLISFQIPVSCENWHVNRLMTLIRICGIKQEKPRKMSKAAQMEQMRELNAKRRAESGSSG